jgi:hypothetical protein
MNKKLLIVSIIAIALVFGGIRFKNWLDIDKCLDSGGRWDYDKKECVYK